MVVPTAECADNPANISRGTTKKPPPKPNIEATKPIPKVANMIIKYIITVKTLPTLFLSFRIKKCADTSITSIIEKFNLILERNFSMSIFLIH